MTTLSRLRHSAKLASRRIRHHRDDPRARKEEALYKKVDVDLKTSPSAYYSSGAEAWRTHDGGVALSHRMKNGGVQQLSFNREGLLIKAERCRPLTEEKMKSRPLSREEIRGILEKLNSDELLRIEVYDVRKLRHIGLLVSPGAFEIAGKSETWRIAALEDGIVSLNRTTKDLNLTLEIAGDGSLLSGEMAALDPVLHRTTRRKVSESEGKYWIKQLFECREFKEANRRGTFPQGT